MTATSSISFGQLHRLPHTIAALDIETLSLDQDAVVHEVGVVFTNILPPKGVLWTLEDLQSLQEAKENGFEHIIASSRIRLLIVEQVLMGRRVDLNTVGFHSKLIKARGQDTLDYFQQHETHAISTNEAKGFLAHLWATYTPTEVWVNHPSFDVPRLVGALFEDKANAVPWRHHEEFDVFTAKHLYRQQLLTGEADLTKFPPNKDIHDSVADCLYNLSVLRGSVYNL
jgi:hypothetical protein